MAEFTLMAEHSHGVTVVSNAFIDYYMCSANGEFVKIYLFLLRCLNQETERFSLLFLADQLNLTERDVTRALNYWQQQGLLEIVADKQHVIKTICVKNIEHVYDQALHTSEAHDIHDAYMQSEDIVLSAEKETAATTDNKTPTAAKSPALTQKASSNIEAQQELTLIAEQYLKRTLSSLEVNKIMYFYEDLHFSIDLIEYLFEHCVTIGNRSIRYIESVAISWADKGITTVEQAKAEGAHYKREYFTILKAFGIHNRTPIDTEVQYMQRWLNEYHFTTDVICEACQRTISKTGNPVFAYTDSILKNWKEHGILAKKDIMALDQAHYAKTQSQKAETRERNSRQARSTKFSNFEQRNDYDFNQLEKQLNHT